MVKRKVSLIGPTTLMVSLPRKWARTYNVTKGDDIDITPHGSRLTISTDNYQHHKPLTIDLKRLNANLIRYSIYAAYRSGANDITLNFEQDSVANANNTSKEHILDIISSVVDNLIGIDIVTQRDTHVTLKEISSVNREEFDNTLQRIFLTLLNTASDLTNAVQTKNTTLLKRIKTLSDKKINKLTDFCLRILNKGGYVATATLPSYYALITALERMGDALEELCDLALTKKVTTKDLTLLHTLFETLYKLYCNYTNDNITTFYTTKNKLRDTKTTPVVTKHFQTITGACSTIIPELMTLHFVP